MNSGTFAETGLNEILYFDWSVSTWTFSPSYYISGLRGVFDSTIFIVFYSILLTKLKLAASSHTPLREHVLFPVLFMEILQFIHYLPF